MNTKIIKNNKKLRVTTVLFFMTLFTVLSVVPAQATTGSGGVNGSGVTAAAAWWRQLTKNGSHPHNTGVSSSGSPFEQLQQVNKSIGSDAHGFSITAGIKDAAGWKKMIDALENQSKPAGYKLSEICEDAEVIYYTGISWQRNNGPGNKNIVLTPDNKGVAHKRPTYVIPTFVKNTHNSKWNQYNDNGQILNATTLDGGKRGATTPETYNKYYRDNTAAWNSGSQILICRTINLDNKPVINPITVTADTHYKKWTGSQIVVSGATLTAGSIKTGHTGTYVGHGASTNPGTTETVVKSVNVTAGGANKNAEYEITKANGKLVIVKDAPDVPDISEERRWVDEKNFELTARINAKTTAVPYKVTGLTNDTTTVDSRFLSTAQGTWLVSNPVSGLQDKTEATWVTWRDDATSKASSLSPSINLGADNYNKLGLHGGIYDVSKYGQYRTYGVTTHQEQVRTWTKGTAIYAPVDPNVPNGTQYITGYTEGYWNDWEDIGERMVKSTRVGTISTRDENFYQLMSVNCNATGFNQAYESYGATKWASGTAQGSGLMKTKNYSAQNLLPLGRGGATSSSAFFTDGTSCKDKFQCTANKLTTALHDASTNDSSNQLFTQQEGATRNPVSSNGSLIFFRDNENREVRADVWYPRGTGVEDLKVDSNASARNTYAKMLAGGTPDLDMVTFAGNGTKIGLAQTRLSGSVNRFNVKSQWSSEADKPQQLALSWEYLGTATNTVPNSVNGDNPQTTVSKSYSFPVYCGFENTNKTNQQASIPSRPHLSGAGAGPLFINNQSVKALFTRSISELKR